MASASALSGVNSFRNSASKSTHSSQGSAPLVASASNCRAPVLHIRHRPHDLLGLVIEGLRAEADVGAARHEERLALGAVAVELGRRGRFKGELLPTGGRSGGIAVTAGGLSGVCG